MLQTVVRTGSESCLLTTPTSESHLDSLNPRWENQQIFLAGALFLLLSLAVSFCLPRVLSGKVHQPSSSSPTPHPNLFTSRGLRPRARRAEGMGSQRERESEGEKGERERASARVCACVCVCVGVVHCASWFSKGTLSWEPFLCPHPTSRSSLCLALPPGQFGDLLPNLVVASFGPEQLPRHLADGGPAPGYDLK